MILQLRVDEKMIKMQLQDLWTKSLADGTVLLVANDNAANTELTKNVLLMNAPSNVKATIRTVDDAIKILADPRGEKMKFFIVVGNTADALKISEAIKIDILNITSIKKGGRELAPTVKVDEKTTADLKQISELGVKVIYQPAPSYPEVDLINKI